MLSRLLWPATAVAALALLAAPGLAQALDPAATVERSPLDQDDQSMGPGESQTFTWRVENAGPTQATATLALQVPAGWAATIEGPTTFLLGTGAGRFVNVRAGLSADAPSPGDLTFSATMTDPAGRTSPPASDSVRLTFVPAPIPPTPRDDTTEIAVGVGSGGAVLLLAVATVVYVQRARQVALFVDSQQRPITTGTDGIFLVEVQNKGRSRREVELRVEGLPATWYGAFSFPKVTLQPGERSPVPLCIKVPREAGDGVQVDIVLRARPGKRYPWLVSGRTRIEAHDRVRIGPVGPVPTRQP